MNSNSVFRFSLANAIATLALVLLPVSAQAHGPTPQKVAEEITIAAPPEKVWQLLTDFKAIASWHPGVSKSVGTVKDGSYERTITLESGGDLGESVDELDDENLSLSYRLAKENVEAMPVSFYSASITVSPAADGSKVEWIARLYRADTTNNPPENLNDAAAVNAVTNFIKKGLEGLKEKAESTE